MTIQNKQDLFHFDLSVLLSMERELEQALGAMAQEVDGQQLKQAFQTHQQQTRQQAQRVEQCFQDLGKQPLNATDETVQGMKTQHDNFLKYHDPSKEVLTFFDAAAARIAEQYEIAKYQSIIQLANQTNHERIAGVLQQNLQEEQQASQLLEGIIQQLSQQPATR